MINNLKPIYFFLVLSLVACVPMGDTYYPSTPQTGYNDPYYGNRDPYYGGGSGYRGDRYDYDRRERDRIEREREALRDERRRLESERERQREQQHHQQQQHLDDRCPPGFYHSEVRCTPEDRKRGCKDLKAPSGRGCVSGR